MLIWVCGPFSPAKADSQKRSDNLLQLNLAAFEVFLRGHTPLIGANMALPLIAVAGGDPAAYEIRGPISLALLQKCDACLRIEGESQGADREVAWFLENGLRVFFTIADIPDEAGAI